MYLSAENGIERFSEPKKIEQFIVSVILSCLRLMEHSVMKKIKKSANSRHQGNKVKNSECLYKGEVIIRVWKPDLPAGRIGHVSLEISENYVSIWPSVVISPANYYQPCEATYSQSLLDDLVEESYKAPDNVYSLYSLNTTHINQEFQKKVNENIKYKLRGHDFNSKYEFRSTNCCGLVVFLLKKGGITRLLGNNIFKLITNEPLAYEINKDYHQNIKKYSKRFVVTLYYKLIGRKEINSMLTPLDLDYICDKTLIKEVTDLKILGPSIGKIAKNSLIIRRWDDHYSIQIGDNVLGKYFILYKQGKFFNCQLTSMIDEVKRNFNNDNKLSSWHIISCIDSKKANALFKQWNGKKNINLDNQMFTLLNKIGSFNMPILLNRIYSKNSFYFKEFLVNTEEYWQLKNDYLETSAKKLKLIDNPNEYFLNVLALKYITHKKDISILLDISLFFISAVDLLSSITLDEFNKIYSKYKNFTYISNYQDINKLYLLIERHKVFLSYHHNLLNKNFLSDYEKNDKLSFSFNHFETEILHNNNYLIYLNKISEYIYECQKCFISNHEYNLKITNFIYLICKCILYIITLYANLYNLKENFNVIRFILRIGLQCFYYSLISVCFYANIFSYAASIVFTYILEVKFRYCTSYALALACYLSSAISMSILLRFKDSKFDLAILFFLIPVPLLSLSCITYDYYESGLISIYSTLIFFLLSIIANIALIKACLLDASCSQYILSYLIQWKYLLESNKKILDPSCIQYLKSHKRKIIEDNYFLSKELINIYDNYSSMYPQSKLFKTLGIFRFRKSQINKKSSETISAHLIPTPCLYGNAK